MFKPKRQMRLKGKKAANGSQDVKPNAYLDALAYAALGATAVVIVAAFFSPLAPLVSLLFPALTLLTAFLLLGRKPALYLSFVWWTWFLTPEVRRVVDFHVGYTEQSLVMLAPYLVTAAALVAVLRNLSRLERPYRAPLAFVALALIYAYGVGLLNNGLVPATFDLLGWSVPVISGAYLLTHKNHIEAFQIAVQRTFLGGLLVMGGYALLQYFLLPPWDSYWMENVNLTTIGFPAPMEVRVFSTLNSPWPFAMIVMAGLLLLLGNRSPIQPLGAIFGLAGFILSAVRSAWGGLIVGLIVIVVSLPFKQQVRFVGTLFALVIVVVPLALVTPLGERFAQRFESVTDLRSDTSFVERVELYSEFSSFTANNPLGQGLGSTGVASGIGNQDAQFRNLDSGIIALVYSFGALGTLYYIGGLLALYFNIIVYGGRVTGLIDAAYLAITVAMLSQLVFSNVWSGVAGMVLWFFPCLYLASRRSKGTSVRSHISASSAPKSFVKAYKI